MKAFRILLVVIFTGVLFYTIVVGNNHGWNLFPVFFGDMTAMTWAGQFDLDFMSFLLLFGLWLAWRHNFSVRGIALGIFGAFGGILVLTPYLFFASFKAKGDMKELLLGKVRANK